VNHKNPKHIDEEEEKKHGNPQDIFAVLPNNFCNHF
jgi:hypothetical protein